jgi:sugar phosphate isomerase/epimerase
MSPNYIKPSVNLDEISPHLEESLSFCKANSLTYVELRTLEGKNLVNFTSDEIDQLKARLTREGYQVSAIASPLFKWLPYGYEEYKPANNIDTFGVPIALALDEKKAMIKRLIEYAGVLQAQYIRIFSSLNVDGVNELPQQELDLFTYASELAAAHSVRLLLENEPAAFGHKYEDYLALLTRLESMGIAAWFDIANLYELGTPVSTSMLRRVANYINYIHVKDPISLGVHKFVPFGEGYINYKRIFADLVPLLTKDVFLSIETHAKRNKIESTQISLDNLTKLLAADITGIGLYGSFDWCMTKILQLSSSDTIAIRAAMCPDTESSIRSALIADTPYISNAISMVEDEKISTVHIQTRAPGATDLLAHIQKVRPDVNLIAG